MQVPDWTDNQKNYWARSCSVDFLVLKMSRANIWDLWTGPTLSSFYVGYYVLYQHLWTINPIESGAACIDCPGVINYIWIHTTIHQEKGFDYPNIYVQILYFSFCILCQTWGETRHRRKMLSKGDKTWTSSQDYKTCNWKKGITFCQICHTCSNLLAWQSELDSKGFDLIPQSSQFNLKILINMSISTGTQ